MTITGAVDAPVFMTARERLERAMMHRLQTGGGIALSGLPTPDARALVEQIHHLAAQIKDDGRAAPGRAAALLTRDRAPQRVLDLGAGRAPWSIALARINDRVRVTAIDLPQEREALLAAIDDAGYASRFEIRVCDAFRDDLGSGYDLVIVANVCHLFPAERNRQLLARAAAALAPGGTLAIIDQVLDLDPDWTVWSALYAVGLPHTLPGGHLFTIAEYSAWLSALGVEPSESAALSAPPALTLLTGRKYS